MGTVIARKRRDGTTGYSAQIVIKVDGKIAHRETKTFDRRQAAAAWLERREGELKRPGALDAVKAGTPTLADAIDRYIAESRKEIGRTKAQVLRSIKDDPLADMKCRDIRSPDLVAFARRRGDSNLPQTVGNYVSHLSAVFNVAMSSWDWPLDEREMKKAQGAMRHQGLIAASQQRDRRPTMDELDRILTFFEERDARGRSTVPMVKVIVFALFSTRRQEEITRLAWADLDEDHANVIVRDMKHPGQKIGNDTRCDVPEPAMRVVLSMPRSGPFIFPYKADAISAAFTRACQMLGIDDLKFHDLRHEGVSRLFEMGFSIPHAAAVSGHRSWASLKRYTHMKTRGDKYDGWQWIERAAL